MTAAFDPEERRPGIGAIINELRLAHMSWSAERLAAEAKRIWHERKGGAEK